MNTILKSTLILQEMQQLHIYLVCVTYSIFVILLLDTLQFTKDLFTTYDLGQPLALNFNAPSSNVAVNLSMHYTQSIAFSDQIVPCSFPSNAQTTCTFASLTPALSPMQLNYTLVTWYIFNSVVYYQNFTVLPNIFQGI